MEYKELNYFAEKEQKGMKNYQKIRDKMFLPISKVLAKINITPDMISYIGLAMLIGFAYFITSKPIYASLFLLAHVMIDVFDGPLARLTNQAGNAGALTDIICDHSGMAIVTILLTMGHLVNGAIASVYIYIYTLMIIFVIVRNKMKIPAKLIIRTKYYVYLLYGLWAFTNINYLNQALIIFSVIMLPLTIISFNKIKEVLKSK